MILGNQLGNVAITSNVYFGYSVFNKANRNK
jgi:hypothetical protein